MVLRCFQIEFSLILGVRLSSAWLDLSNVFEEFSLTLFPLPLIAHALRSGMFRPASLIEGSWRIPTAVLGSQLVCMFGWSRQGLFSPSEKFVTPNAINKSYYRLGWVFFSCPLTILWISTNNYLNNWYIVTVIGQNKIHVKHSHFNSYCMNFNNSNAEINLPILPNLSRAVCTTLSPSSTESATTTKKWKLKGTKTHISSLLLYFYKVFIIEHNQWKFEQNQAKNKEVTALWNLAISRGRYSKWWQVVDNSPYVLYMKFHVFPLFWWLRQFPSLKSRYDKQGCILHGILWSRAMKTHVSKENWKRMKFCVQNEWRVVHNCPHNLITALYCSLDLKML